MRLYGGACECSRRKVTKRLQLRRIQAKKREVCQVIFHVDRRQALRERSSVPNRHQLNDEDLIAEEPGSSLERGPLPSQVYHIRRFLDVAVTNQPRLDFPTPLMLEISLLYQNNMCFNDSLE